MATLNVKLNLDTKDLFSDELNFSVADTLSILGKSVRKTVARLLTAITGKQKEIIT